VRQFIRPGNKTHVPSASVPSNVPPALLPKRGARASLSGLPMPASASTATLRITKKAMKPEMGPAPAPAAVAVPLPRRKTAGSTTLSSHAAGTTTAVRSVPAPLQQSPPRRNIELRGVQRPPVPTKVVGVAAPLTAATSVRAPSQPQRNKQTVAQTQAPSKVPGAGLRRPSGLRPPTSRTSVSGIAVPRRVSVGGGGATRPSMAVGGGSGNNVGGGRLGLGLGGSSGAIRAGLVKGDGTLSLASARMMRRA
jgi:hypothetical protein